MPVEARHSEILRLLDAGRCVKVSDLSRRLGVSGETIRRDLERLEREGAVRRIHGGAVRVLGRAVEVPFTSRRTRQIDQKRRIARLARTLVSNGDTILIDASTSTLELAKSLPPMEVTVVTNSLQAVMELGGLGVDVIATGGTLRHPSLSMVGPVALRTLEERHADTVFFSCRGLTLGEGVTDASDVEADMKHRMIRAARRAVLLADGSKLGRVGFCSICPVGDLFAVVTDREAPAETLEELRAAGVRVLVG